MEGEKDGEEISVQTLPRLPTELWGCVFSFLDPIWRGLARSVCPEWRQAVALPSSTAFNPSIMAEASDIFLKENFINCSRWTVSQGCKRPFLIRCRKEETKPLMIDLGSDLVKAGFVGNDAPHSVFPTIVGHPRLGPGVMVGMGEKSNYVGDEAQSQRSLLALHHPIQRGAIADINKAELLLHHIFYNELRCAPEEHPVLLTQAAFNPKAHGENLMQLLFEKFEVPAMYIANQALLTCYAYARSTGLAVCVGDGATQVLALDQGLCTRRAISRSNFAGWDVTENLQTLLFERGYDLSRTSAEWEIVRDLKEKRCFTSLDYEKDMETARTSSQLEIPYELPDGTVITIGDERFRCIEPLFNSSLLGLEIPGIHQQILKVIMKLPAHRRKTFYSEILLAGGTSLTPDFEQRVQLEVAKLAPQGMTVKVHAAPERKYSVWIGGSIMGALSTFEPMWIAKDRYDEYGPNLSHSFF
mgnify:FL=1